MAILTRIKAPENAPMRHRGYASAPESERQALHRPRPARKAPGRPHDLLPLALLFGGWCPPSRNSSFI